MEAGVMVAVVTEVGDMVVAVFTQAATAEVFTQAVSTLVDFTAAAFMLLAALRGEDAATARSGSHSTPPGLTVPAFRTAWRRTAPRKAV
jgi:hypothetical protein